VQSGLPVTPAETLFSPRTKPLIVPVSDGFDAPYGRLVSSAVTVRGAGATETSCGPSVSGSYVASPP